MSYGTGGGGGAPILVTFASIAEASQNVNSTYNTLNTKLDDLHKQLQPIVQDWTGAAAENYQAKQAQWTQAQQELGQVLQQIAQVLEAAHDAYMQTETANKNTWQ